MSKNYAVGFPRIGEQRELKKALEAYWQGVSPFAEVETVAKALRKRHWEYQKDAGIKLISSNDFSYYDGMLDTVVMVGAIPERFAAIEGEGQYFAMARGTKSATAMEMTKWFNTNYHYIVPEIGQETRFALNASKIIKEYKEAKAHGIIPKINIIGPITFLALSKSNDGSDVFVNFTDLVDVYVQLLEAISALDETIVVQVDEPIFVKDVEPRLLSLLKPTYERLGHVSDNIRVLVMTYFEHAVEAVKILVETPVWGIGLDFVHGKKNHEVVELISQRDKVLFAGVIDGRNIWRTDLHGKAKEVKALMQGIAKEKLYLGTSCSLLHVPFTLKYETELEADIRAWLSFACEKLEEVVLLSKVVFDEPLSEKEQEALSANNTASLKRMASTLIHDRSVQERFTALSKKEREGVYEERIALQKEALSYPDLATTTIGSFPQTPQIRQVRQAFKNGVLSANAYEAEIKRYIDECVAFQESIGLDVLVHGEPERNDMVEYFGAMLKGIAFTKNGWVQSYGSRCVKPPFIYGDVSRPKPMTVAWSTYAQSKTKKIMKGMLTGPVTILNWSFVRDDLPRAEVSRQIALGICDEVQDLQEAGIKIIQVDEAAFKEGYPLRKADISAYEAWAVESFKLAVSSADKVTQIHTHMCYSDFNDIIKTIEKMDADVISIETARSGNRLLRIFQEVGYKQEVGPGVYDIHSPRVPSVEEMKKQIEKLLEVLPQKQLWINPDCGLKTRSWDEVRPSLHNMVKAVEAIRG